MGGRPALPAEVHKRQGTYRKDRHEAREAQLLDCDEFPTMPTNLAETPGAVDLWRFVEECMAGQGIYAKVDAVALSAYCRLEAQFQQGMGDPTRGGLTPSEMNTLSRLRTELYLTPASRAKVGRKKEKEKNPFDSL